MKNCTRTLCRKICKSSPVMTRCFFCILPAPLVSSAVKSERLKLRGSWPREPSDSRVLLTSASCDVMGREPIPFWLWESEVANGVSRAIDVGSPIPMPEISVGPMLPNGKEPPVIPPGVDPIEPSERSLPPEDPDDGNPRAISTIPLYKANQHMLHQDASSLWTSKRPK